MKITTTISLEPELLQQLSNILSANGQDSLSKIIEDLLRAYLATARRETSDERDFKLIDMNADRLNQEAEDVLTCQIGL